MFFKEPRNFMPFSEVINNSNNNNSSKSLFSKNYEILNSKEIPLNRIAVPQWRLKLDFQRDEVLELLEELVGKNGNLIQKDDIYSAQNYTVSLFDKYLELSEILFSADNQTTTRQTNLENLVKKNDFFSDDSALIEEQDVIKEKLKETIANSEAHINKLLFNRRHFNGGASWNEAEYEMQKPFDSSDIVRRKYLERFYRILVKSTKIIKENEDDVFHYKIQHKMKILPKDYIDTAETSLEFGKGKYFESLQKKIPNFFLEKGENSTTLINISVKTTIVELPNDTKNNEMIEHARLHIEKGSIFASSIIAGEAGFDENNHNPSDFSTMDNRIDGAVKSVTFRDYNEKDVLQSSGNRLVRNNNIEDNHLPKNSKIFQAVYQRQNHGLENTDFRYDLYETKPHNIEPFILEEENISTRSSRSSDYATHVRTQSALDFMKEQIAEKKKESAAKDLTDSNGILKPNQRVEYSEKIRFCKLGLDTVSQDLLKMYLTSFPDFVFYVVDHSFDAEWLNESFKNNFSEYNEDGTKNPNYRDIRIVQYDSSKGEGHGKLFQDATTEERQHFFKENENIYESNVYNAKMPSRNIPLRLLFDEKGGQRIANLQDTSGSFDAPFNVDECDIIAFGADSSDVTIEAVASLANKNKGKSILMIFETVGCGGRMNPFLWENRLTVKERESLSQKCTYLAEIWEQSICTPNLDWTGYREVAVARGMGEYMRDTHCFIGIDENGTRGHTHFMSPLCTCVATRAGFMDPITEKAKCNEFEFSQEERNSYMLATGNLPFMGLAQWRQDWFLYHNFFKSYNSEVYKSLRDAEFRGSSDDLHSIAPFLSSSAKSSNYDHKLHNSRLQRNKFLHEVLFKHTYSGKHTKNHHRKPIFLDIGAMQPFHLSNTASFEQCHNWRGICVEPNPRFRYHMLNYRANCLLAPYCIHGGGKRKRNTTNRATTEKKDNAKKENDLKKIHMDSGSEENSSKKSLLSADWNSEEHIKASGKLKANDILERLDNPEGRSSDFYMKNRRKMQELVDNRAKIEEKLNEQHIDDMSNKLEGSSEDEIAHKRKALQIGINAEKFTSAQIAANPDLRFLQGHGKYRPFLNSDAGDKLI